VFDLYLITPDREPAWILSRARLLFENVAVGRLGIQLRSKALASAERAALARALRELTQQLGAALLINTDLELAREVEADGVQLPEHGPAVAAARARLGQHALIGASRHDSDGVRAAERDGATFVTLGPVFSVPQKGEPLGLAALAEIARAGRIPVFGLGGIDLARCSEVVRSGAHGIAVIREVWDDAQPARKVAELLAVIDAAR
jgi:thiamine-phosphate pyrophosphorylase